MSRAQPGKVYLVGAGPGDPELLTVKAHSLLRRADVILHDDLVSEAIVSLAGPHARVINVGKRCGAKTITQTEINRLMISFALGGMDVVRLKSGDPGIFGRLAEELDALSAANVASVVVPGVTTALAAAASLGVALTDRRSSSKLVFVSGHHADGIEPEEKTDWRELVSDHTTLVVYMPGRDLGNFSGELMDAGLPAEIPCVVISRVSTAEERRTATTLGDLSSVPVAETPSILLMGQSIGRAGQRTLAEMPIRDCEAICRCGERVRTRDHKITTSWEMPTMTEKVNGSAREEKPRGFRLSLDGWAVTLALFLSLLVALGVIKKVPW